MKEIIVIPKEHIEYEQISGAGFDTIRFHLGTDKTLEVPENWEELKDLCKGLNKIRIANVEGTESIILNDNLICDKYGNVFVDFSEHTYCLAQNRTTPQLWAFIKSLIGEEQW